MNKSELQQFLAAQRDVEVEEIVACDFETALRWLENVPGWLRPLARERFIDLLSGYLVSESEKRKLSYLYKEKFIPKEAKPMILERYIQILRADLASFKSDEREAFHIKLEFEYALDDASLFLKGWLQDKLEKASSRLFKEIYREFAGEKKLEIFMKLIQLEFQKRFVTDYLPNSKNYEELRIFFHVFYKEDFNELIIGSENHCVQLLENFLVETDDMGLLKNTYYETPGKLKPFIRNRYWQILSSRLLVENDLASLYEMYISCIDGFFLLEIERRYEEILTNSADVISPNIVAEHMQKGMLRDKHLGEILNGELCKGHNFFELVEFYSQYPSKYHYLIDERVRLVLKASLEEIDNLETVQGILRKRNWSQELRWRIEERYGKLLPEYLKGISEIDGLLFTFRLTPTRFKGLVKEHFKKMLPYVVGKMSMKKELERLHWQVDEGLKEIVVEFVSGLLGE